MRGPMTRRLQNSRHVVRVQSQFCLSNMYKTKNNPCILNAFSFVHPA